jgi:small subunit ribosomal protein S6
MQQKSKKGVCKMSYECTFICSPELDSAKIEELTSKASKIIENAGGTVKNLQQLGKKKLAYNVKKFREGIYVYMELSGSGSMVSSLETFFKVNDSIIRFLTIKVEPKKKIVAKKSAEKKVEEVKTEIFNESAELPTATAE